MVYLAVRAAKVSLNAQSGKSCPTYVVSNVTASLTRDSAIVVNIVGTQNVSTWG